jgi:hypothetical protein
MLKYYIQFEVFMAIKSFHCDLSGYNAVHSCK